MILMKTSARSTGCPKTGKRVKNLGALVLLCVGLLLAGSLAAGGTGPDLLLETDIRLEAGPWRAMVEKAETGPLAGLPVLTATVKGHGDTTGSGVTSRWPDDNPHVAPETSEAVEHFRFTDAAKLPAQQARKFGLRQPDHFSGLLLAPAMGLDDFADLRRKLRLHQHFVGVGKIQVGVDVTAAHIKFNRFIVHFPSFPASASAVFSRSRIKSRSGLGVAMPWVDFF